MKLFDYPIIKLTILFVSGILFGYHFSNITPQFLLGVIASVILFVSICFIRSQKHFIQKPTFGLTVYILFFSLGCLTYYLHQDNNHHRHYSKFNDENYFELRITEHISSGIYYNRYFAEITKYGKHDVLGKLLLLIDRKSFPEQLSNSYDLLVYGKLEKLNMSLNPHEFDYSKYLSHKQVFHQLKVDRNQCIIRKTEKNSIKIGIESLHQTIQEKLHFYKLNKQTIDLLNALILGQRKNMDKELYQNYVAAGAVHILALSGLHVGIITLIISWLTKPLSLFIQNKLVSAIIVVIFLWAYAVFTGLSPSVLRSVTMFSLIVIAINLKRKTNTYNTLFISMFVLLLYNANLIFEIGFQLSYSAVLGIVALQPKFAVIWKPRNFVSKYFWNILTVSFAAQLSVLPLSLFYFHQLPTLSFISNLVILPFLGLIIGFGIIIIFILLADLHIGVIIEAFDLIISSLNHFVNFMGGLKSTILSEIPFNLPLLFCSYLLLFLGYYAFNKQQKAIPLFLSTILLFQTIIYVSSNKSTEEFIVFHKTKYSIFGQRNNNYLQISTNTKHSDKSIQQYVIGEFIEDKHYTSFRNVYTQQEEIILVIDSLSVYSPIRFKPKVIVLRQSPKINLERVIQELNPDKIIADGSNYKSYIERWKETCRNKKIPFHYTGETGAFILKK